LTHYRASCQNHFKPNSLQVRMSDRLAMVALVVAVTALAVIVADLAVHG
jgi:hypothetical protein